MFRGQARGTDSGKVQDVEFLLGAGTQLEVQRSVPRAQGKVCEVLSTSEQGALTLSETHEKKSEVVAPGTPEVLLQSHGLLASRPSPGVGTPRREVASK